MSATASPPTPCPWNRLHPSQKPNDPCSIQRCLNAPCYRFKGADRLCEHQLSIVKLRVARIFFLRVSTFLYFSSYIGYSVSLWHPDANWWNSGETQKSNYEPRLVIFCYLTRHYTADWGGRSKKITTPWNTADKKRKCHKFIIFLWPLAYGFKMTVINLLRGGSVKNNFFGDYAVCGGDILSNILIRNKPGGI